MLQIGFKELSVAEKLLLENYYGWIVTRKIQERIIVEKLLLKNN
jgi:hypothetical protein